MFNLESQLLNYISSNADAKKFYEIAMRTYFAEPLGVPSVNISELAKILGDDQFELIYDCAMEFFFSNNYCISEEDGIEWNVIGEFLKAQGSLLTQSEKNYIKQLRDSYMSIYEIVEVIPEKGVILRDLIEPGELIKVSEKESAKDMVKWDILGARLLKLGNKTIMAGGCTTLPRDIANKSIETIQHIEKKLLKSWKNETLPKPKISKEKQQPYQKKLWSLEIGWRVLLSMLEKPPVISMINSSGDALEYCKVKFPITKPKGQIIAILEKLEELKIIENKINKSVFYWVQSIDYKAHVDTEYKNCTIKDINVFSPEREKFSLFAEIIIQGKELIGVVNSRQRANILEDYITSHLGHMVGAATFEYIDPMELEDGWLEPQSSTSVSLLSKGDKLLQEMDDAFYKEWANTKMQVLGGKTPRQAVKTEKGKKQVIALLKKIENQNLRSNKFYGDKVYDFLWLWEELGLHRSAA